MKVVELPRRERERWEGGEEESNYMVMSPQPRYSLPVCPPEDYTPMEGPEEEWSPGPSHCMSMDRCVTRSAVYLILTAGILSEKPALSWRSGPEGLPLVET